MKQIYSLITALCSFALTTTYAQNDYKNIGNMEAGTELVFQRCEADSFTEGNSGENVTWDFSNLKSTKDTTTEWIVHPDAIAVAKDYPGANLAEKYSDGSYVFLKKEDDKTYLLGFVNEDAKLQMSYPKPMLIAKRPFSFGEKITAPYTTTYTVNGLRLGGKGTVTMEADGWGTLILPNNTYQNVLRVKMTQLQADVLEKYNTMNETVITTYVWFDKEHASALLKVTETRSKYYTDKKVEYLLKETVK